MRVLALSYLAAAFVALVSASPLATPRVSEVEDIAPRAHQASAIDCGPVGSKEYCKDTDYSTDRPKYLCGDPRLGPAMLPHWGPVTKLVAHWQRFGNLCPGEFLKQWTIDGKYVFPSGNGFILDSRGQPVEEVVVLKPGTLVDRIGNENGRFLSPINTPYSHRSIPPSNLNTDDPKAPANYYRYEVVKPVKAVAGQVRPWFQQKGYGTQFQLSGKVIELLRQGYLRRVVPR